MNGGMNWVQWALQSIVTSFIIGYTLVVIGMNRGWLESKFQTKGSFYVMVILSFFVVGLIATEMEQVIQSLVFQKQAFQWFSAGKMYWFKCKVYDLSIVLGIGKIFQLLIEILNQIKKCPLSGAPLK